MKFYAVRIGRVPGVYETWDECLKQVNRYPNNRYKSFSTRQEAQSFVDGIAAVPPSVSSAPLVRKRPSSVLPLPPVVKKRSVSTEVWTDGACGGNGTASSNGGIGVYFGPDDPRNLAEPLPECYRPHTNQKAELFAVVRAVQVILSSGGVEGAKPSVILGTDSAYAIGWATKWGPDWEAKGWRKNGQAASNETLARLLTTTLAEAKSRGFEFEFRHVKGHSGIPGNEEADKLAVKGSQTTPPKQDLPVYN